MSFEEYAELARLRYMRGHERSGQAHYNELNLHRPDLAEALIGTKYDPYYDDERLGSFFTFIRERW